ncbi:MAG: aminotransferase class I/II-fold pyridoxal phosphate-dependent enzyme [Bradymonadales bacterium]|nr:MAG: aminotransferase class I/II-fold pyridoxal phosphate-dependent enzyme [Bradymonadales bacterium]
MKIRDFQLERYFAKYEFTARYLLSSSDSESLSVSDLLAFEPEAERGLKDLWLGYTESFGHPALRREISKTYEAMPAENVLVHAGAQEAIFNFMNVVLEAGDHVIVQSPCYQSLAEVANSIGCELTFWGTRHEEQWRPDLEFLESSLKPKTKLVVINSPNNPTGHLLSKDDFSSLIQILRKRGVMLFSDEVYRLSEYDPGDQLPAAADAYELGVSLGVMSKSYGLAGLRIGWVATRMKKVLERLAAFKDYTSICSSAPSEFLAMLALRHAKPVLQRNRDIAIHNLALLRETLGRLQSQIEWVEPKAGVIAFPRFKDADAEKFAEDLVAKKSVMLLPGKYFDFDKRHFRLGFGRKNFSEALNLFEEHVVETFRAL